MTQWELILHALHNEPQPLNDRTPVGVTTKSRKQELDAQRYQRNKEKQQWAADRLKKLKAKRANDPDYPPA